MKSREFHYTLKPLKNRRRELRNNPTKAEKKLWDEIKNKKLGLKFTRQYSIDGYVLDFYCQSKRIAIEVEGGIHHEASQIKYDKFREKYIISFDITVLKFSNDEVLNNIESVKTIILGVPS